jgi:hypothetical protein
MPVRLYRAEEVDDDAESYCRHQPHAIALEQSMRSILLATVAVGSALALGDASALAASTTVMQAPIGHLQPRAQQFSPRSPAEQTEQQRMSTFDAEQQKLDEELDKRLNICRC